jgi:mono/diheme cytochrome c family protein
MRFQTSLAAILTGIKAAEAPMASYDLPKAKEPAMRHMIFLAVSVLGAASALAAEDVGDPQAGFEYAQRVCSGCHGISAETSRVPKATRFREVADRPGMTGTALRVWIETYHPTMPNIVVDKQDMLNVIAYILSLKGRDADQPGR